MIRMEEKFYPHQDLVYELLSSKKRASMKDPR